MVEIRCDGGHWTGEAVTVLSSRPRLGGALDRARVSPVNTAVPILVKLHSGPHPAMAIDSEDPLTRFAGACPYPEDDPQHARWRIFAQAFREGKLRLQAEMLDGVQHASIGEKRDRLVEYHVRRFDLFCSFAIEMVIDDDFAAAFEDLLPEDRDHLVASFSKDLDSGPAWLRGVGLDLLLEARLAQRVAHWTAEALAAARRSSGAASISTPTTAARHAVATGGAEFSSRQGATGDVPLVSERPPAAPGERQEPVARTDAVFDVARYDLEAADGRRRAIDDYLRICTASAGETIRRTHIWRWLGHRFPRTFLYWQAAKKGRQSRKCDTAVRQVLQTPPATFIEQLRAKGLLPAIDAPRKPSGGIKNT